MNVTELLGMYENIARAKNLYYVARAMHHVDLSEQYININRA
jgi:hypothetical protein